MNCQRWLTRRQAWRPAGEPFLPTRHAVELVDDADAKRFVCEHHYSGTYVAARMRVGLFRAGVGLVGVAVFSVPIQPRAIPSYTNLEAAAGVELGRFVLLDEVEGNGESWFLARAFRLLEERLQVQAVLSYSDPMPRADVSGNVVTPGHVGIIYQAYNGLYAGRTRPASLVLLRDGRTLSRRAISKLKHGEVGAAYVYARFLAAGAPRRKPLESGPAYVKRALAEGPFRQVRHPGNHAYVWALGSKAHRRELLRHFARARPYPKPEKYLL